MNFPLLILVVLSIIYGVICSEAGTSEIASVLELDPEFKKLKNDLYRPTPAFMAFMAAPGRRFKHKETILFSDVRLNLVGCYNAMTGVFQAPVSGTYHFAVNALNVEQVYSADIVAGDGQRVIGSIRYFGVSPSEVRSVSVLAHLKVNETVMIKCSFRDCLLDSGTYTSFNGFLFQHD